MMAVPCVTITEQSIKSREGVLGTETGMGKRKRVMKGKGRTALAELCGNRKQ